MKKKATHLLSSARNSLILAIEVFNRPHEQGRTEAVLMMLDHAFEMLMKAIIYEKTGRIRKPKDKFNYSFEKCVDICLTNLSVIDGDEALIVKNLNGFRDAAQHDILILSEGLLFGHAQSAVRIFGSLLKKVFNQELASFLPRRILPISTELPDDIHCLISSDMDAARKLLGSKQRKEDEAEARLRPYQIIEENLRNIHGVKGAPLYPSMLVKRLKQNDWKFVLPMVAGLVKDDLSGIPITLHVDKSKGIPVRIDPKAATAIAFRYIKTEDKYPFLTSELAGKLSISTNKVVGFVKVMGLKGEDEFHTSIKVSKAGDVNRYSQKAFTILDNAIKKHGIDFLWELFKQGKKLSYGDYMDGHKPHAVTIKNGDGNGKTMTETA